MMTFDKIKCHIAFSTESEEGGTMDPDEPMHVG